MYRHQFKCLFKCFIEWFCRMSLRGKRVWFGCLLLHFSKKCKKNHNLILVKSTQNLNSLGLIRQINPLMSCSTWSSWLGSGIWSGCLLVTSLWRFFRHIQLGGGPGADPEHAGGISYPVWAGNAPRRSWTVSLESGMSGFPARTCCLCRPVTPDTLKITDECPALSYGTTQFSVTILQLIPEPSLSLVIVT